MMPNILAEIQRNKPRISAKFQLASTVSTFVSSCCGFTLGLKIKFTTHPNMAIEHFAAKYHKTSLCTYFISVLPVYIYCIIMSKLAGARMHSLK